MTRLRYHLIASAILVAFAAPPLRANTLDQAFAALQAKKYDRASYFVNVYYSNGGARRYRSEFIRAVAECRLTYNNSRLKALRVEYWLTAAVEAEVNRWINSCKPLPPRHTQPNENGQVSKVSDLTSLPPVDSATVGPEPRSLPRMSPLFGGAAYIGDDYARRILPSPEACQRVCQIQAPCRSMTYDLSKKICWLKRSVPAVGRADGFVASRKQSN